MTRPEVSSPSRATRHSLITTEPAPCVGSGPAGRWAHRGVSPSAVGRRMPGSRSGEVAGKAPGIVQVLDQRFAHEHARTQAASRENVILVLRDGAQARDEVLLKDTRYRLLDASGAARSWLPC